MKLISEEGRRIVFDDHDDWEYVEERVIETDRWTIRYLGVFEHIPSKKYYQICWSQGATEQQDELPFEYDAPEPIEVVQKEILVKTWVPADEV